jgi:hypothetical protein
VSSTGAGPVRRDERRHDPFSATIIVISATSFCVNWAFLIARGTRLKHERIEGFKASLLSYDVDGFILDAFI